MALVLADRVKETTTTTGTSDFSLGGAVSGFQTFSQGVGNSNTTYYAISLGSDWEVGLGTLSSDGLTLARTTVLQSSNSDTKVSFASGSKDIFVTYAADKAVFEDASGNVTLPANLTVTGGSTTDSVQLDLSAGVTPAVGQIAWDANQGTASLGLLGGNVISRIGQSLVAYVTNAESTTITKGQAVYLFSAQGDRATVKLAYNTGDATSAKTLGIVAEDITANGTGFVVCQGVVYGLSLGSYTAGDTVYLGSTAGSLTATKPYAPNHLVYIGVVEKANAGAGQLYVRVQNGYELDEIHNVSAQSPSDGQTIVYNSSTSLWEKNTVSLTAGVNGTLPVANGGTGITSLGTGVATFLGTPSSANLASAVTDETGTGALVFANSPTLVTPTLGTPASATLTNATGLPLSTGVTGTLPTTNGGTGLTSFTSGSVVYASSTSALATGTALQFNGSNLGLGVTPSAWGSDYKVIQLTGGSIAGYQTSTLDLYSNAYDSAAGVWKYVSTNFATRYAQTSGKHIWFNAPSGTAGNAITFTQAMTLDASGNLGIGTTTPNTVGYGGAVLGLYGGSNAGGNVWLTSDATAAGNRTGRIGFGTEGNSTNKETARVWSVIAGSTAGNVGGDLLFSTKPDGGALAERARISSTGGLSVGTTADPGAGAIYATGNITAYYSSDIKFKENVRDIPDALATVNAIGGKLFDWTDDYIESKGGADGYFVQKADFGVVAQDVQKVFPIAVRTREDGSLAVDYEKLGALAFAALVELTKRVEALEAK